MSPGVRPTCGLARHRNATGHNARGRRHPRAGTIPSMGMILRLLLTRLLPARFAWVVTAFVLGRALAARRRPQPVPVRPDRRSDTYRLPGTW